MNLSSATPPRGYRKSGIAIGDSNRGPTPPSGSSRFAAATARLRRFDAPRCESQDRPPERLRVEPPRPRRVRDGQGREHSAILEHHFLHADWLPSISRGAYAARIHPWITLGHGAPR